MKRNGGWKGDEGVKARAKELNYHFSYARRCVNPTIHVHVPALIGASPVFSYARCYIGHSCVRMPLALAPFGTMRR